MSSSSPPTKTITDNSNNNDTDNTTVNSWLFNPFISTKTYNTTNALAILGPTIVFRNPLILKYFQSKTIITNNTTIDLIPFFNELQSLYRKIPYHNALHGLAVGQSVACLLLSTKLGEIIQTHENPPLTTLSLVISAFAHDVSHPGFNNDFLIRTKSPIILTYGTESPLEQMHASTLLLLLRKPNIAPWFTQLLSTQEQEQFQRLAIKFILDTDMSFHMSIVNTLENSSKSRMGVEDLCGAALHLCDISSAVKSNQYKSWSSRVLEEFRLQGDEEVIRNWIPAPLFDRVKTKDPRQIYKLHYDFASRVVLPLFRAFHLHVDFTFQIQDCLIVCEEWWKEIMEMNPNGGGGGNGTIILKAHY
jgi:hypothetical protein